MLDETSGRRCGSLREGVSFDLVTMWDVIEHVPDPQELLLARRARCSSPDGRLILETQNVDSSRFAKRARPALAPLQARGAHLPLQPQRRSASRSTRRGFDVDDADELVRRQVRLVRLHRRARRAPQQGLVSVLLEPAVAPASNANLYLNFGDEMVVAARAGATARPEPIMTEPRTVGSTGLETWKQQRRTTQFAELEENHFWFRGRRVDLPRRCSTAGGRRRTRRNLDMLEIGCGPGGILGPLERFGTVHGLDIAQTTSMEFCAVARIRRASSPAPATSCRSRTTASTSSACSTRSSTSPTTSSVLARRPRASYKPDGHVFISVPAYQFLYSQNDRHRPPLPPLHAAKPAQAGC